jgi:hypothetical protein
MGDKVARYIVEEDDGGHHLAVDVIKEGKWVSLVSKHYSVDDDGNGWTFRSCGREVRLSYSDVADIVNSALIFNSFHGSFHSCKVYRQVAGLENKRSKKAKEKKG